MSSRRIIAITTDTDQQRDDIAIAADLDLGRSYGDVDATAWDDAAEFMLDMIEGTSGEPPMTDEALRRIVDALDKRLGRRGPIVDTADVASRLGEPEWQGFDPAAVRRIVGTHGSAEGAAAAIQASGALDALDDHDDAGNERVRAAIRSGIALVDVTAFTR